MKELGLTGVCEKTPFDEINITAIAIKKRFKGFIF